MTRETLKMHVEEVLERLRAQDRRQVACTCRWPSIDSASLYPPDGPVTDPYCPTHGPLYDEEYEK